MPDRIGDKILERAGEHGRIGRKQDAAAHLAHTDALRRGYRALGQQHAFDDLTCTYPFDAWPNNATFQLQMLEHRGDEGARRRQCLTQPADRRRLLGGTPSRLDAVEEQGGGLERLLEIV